MSIHLSRRRRSLAIVGAFAATALVLSACTNSDDGGGSAVSNQGGENDEAGKKIRIGFSAPAADHGWMSAITKNAVAQAKAYEDDVELINAEGTNDVNQQISQAQKFIDDKVDPLVQCPVRGADV